jgi:hypothetical protein
VQNAGCDFTRGESCVYDTAKDNALCGQLTARLAHEEPCSPLDNVCDRNLTCTALPQEHESSCHRVCDPDTGAGCENLPGTSPNYMCMRLVDRGYGVCVGTGIRCDPNEDPCADTEVCSLRGGEPVCLPAGAAKLGESCLVEQCAKGGLCIKLKDLPEPRCSLPCDTDDAICPNPDEVCTGVDEQRFGICQKSTPQCSPLAVADNRCPDGQICSLERADPDLHACRRGCGGPGLRRRRRVRASGPRGQRRGVRAPVGGALREVLRVLRPVVPGVQQPGHRVQRHRAGRLRDLHLRRRRPYHST